MFRIRDGVSIDFPLKYERWGDVETSDSETFKDTCLAVVALVRGCLEHEHRLRWSAAEFNSLLHSLQNQGQAESSRSHTILSLLARRRKDFEAQKV